MFGPQVRLEGGELTVEAQQGARHQGLARQEAGVVDQKAGLEVVAAVGHQVVIADQGERVALDQAHRVGDDRDVGIDALDHRHRALGFRRAELVGGVHDLALQVRQAHRVVIDDADGADAGRRKVKQQRRAETAAPITSTREAISLAWPAPPISLRMMWRA